MHQADTTFTGIPVRIPKALREGIEAAIQAHLTAVEKLTAVLDRADGDLDLEPSLGHHPYGRPLSLTDCEGGDVQDGPHDPEPDERDLGWGPGVNQPHALRQCWGDYRLPDGTWDNRDTDREGEHDGREPQCEDEGAACDDEGVDTDCEPLAHPETCGGSYGA
jgi:hypothetical protein